MQHLNSSRHEVLWFLFQLSASKSGNSDEKHDENDNNSNYVRNANNSNKDNEKLRRNTLSPTLVQSLDETLRNRRLSLDDRIRAPTTKVGAAKLAAASAAPRDVNTPYIIIDPLSLLSSFVAVFCTGFCLVDYSGAYRYIVCMLLVFTLLYICHIMVLKLQ